MNSLWFPMYFVRPFIALEIPGWGKLYRQYVDGHQANERWNGAGVKVIKDKRYQCHRVLDLSEWADRSLYFLRRWYDLPIQLAIEKLLVPGAKVMDVGANYGHFSMAAATLVGAEGQVWSFEPNPASFSRLRVHVDLNGLKQVEAVNCGVSEEPGELELTIPSINSGEATFGKSAYPETHSVVCRIETVDRFLNGREVDLIKIDVEGFEERVLKGAQETIKKHRPIVITEIVKNHLGRAGSSPSDIRAYFDDLGYRSYRLSLKSTLFQKDVLVTECDGDLSNGDYLWVPSDIDPMLLAGLSCIGKAG